MKAVKLLEEDYVKGSYSRYMTWQDLWKAFVSDFNLMIFSKLIIYHKILRTYWPSKRNSLVNIAWFSFLLYDKIET